MCGLLELGPGPQHVAVEVFNVGRWLTHGTSLLDLAVRTHFDRGRWTCKVTHPVQCTRLWLASWLLAVHRVCGKA